MARSLDTEEDPMKDTAEQSAELKQALKHDPATDALRREAELFPLEATEALSEVEQGFDERTPGSWVDEVMQQ